METRIEINGIWYIREDSINDPIDYIESEELDFTWTENCIFEDNSYAFEVSRTRKCEDCEFYPDIMITLTIKKGRDRSNWGTEYLDNNNWFIGVLENNPESLKELDSILCNDGKRIFKLILKKLVDIGWLKLNKDEE